jgi:hypothetical protein
MINGLDPEMAKKFNLHFEEFQKHVKAQEKYAKMVASIFSKAVDDAAAIGANLSAPVGKAFSFADYPQAKKAIDQLTATMASDISATITEGTAEEWLHAAKMNDSLVQAVFHNTKLSKGQIEKYMKRNLDALYAFQTRKMGGLNLSDRVWKYTSQFKQEIEMGLDIGLGEGKSAAALSRDLKQYLQNPDKLFHRVRDKHGKLQLSKNAKAYHPGQGVYRSSHKNAMRLTRTEVNMAYRTSDFVRIQQLDFVIGIRVKLSNNHTLNGVPFVDICDDLAGEYPKDFVFNGWHPQCRCHTETILASEEEFLDYQQAILDGEDVTDWKFTGEVKELPKQFTSWVDNHSEAIKTAKNLPYFLKDNFAGANIQGAAKSWSKTAQNKSVKNLNETQKALNEQAALAYEKEYAQKKIEQALAAGYGGPELEALKSTLGDPGATPSQLAGKANKLLHAVKGVTKKANTTPAPAPTTQQKEVVKKAVSEHKPADPLKAQFEKDYTPQEIDGLLDAYYKHTAKKESKSPGEYLGYLDFEINWLKENTLTKYKTSPALLKLLQAEHDKIQAIVSKEAIKAAKEIKAAQELSKAPPVKIKGVPTTYEDTRAVNMVLAEKEIKRLEKELAGTPVPTKQTLEHHYSKKELRQIRELELKRERMIVSAGGDDWNYAVTTSEGELNTLRRDLAIKYHDKKRRLPHRDKLTTKEYEAFLEAKKSDLKFIYGDRFPDNKIAEICERFGLYPEEFKAIITYTSNEGYAINTALRTNSLTPARKYATIAASRGLTKMPRFEGVLRRGIGGDTDIIIAQMKEALRKGTKWEDKGFFSTAYRGGGFTGNIKVMVKTKGGGILDRLSAHPSEAEVLLRAGSKYTIKSLYQRNGYWYVSLIEE